MKSNGKQVNRKSLIGHNKTVVMVKANRRSSTRHSATQEKGIALKSVQKVMFYIRVIIEAKCSYFKHPDISSQTGGRCARCSLSLNELFVGRYVSNAYLLRKQNKLVLEVSLYFIPN